MKTKLTLSIDDKIVRKAKRDAKKKGISLSKLFERKLSVTPDKKQAALLRLRKMLDETKPVKSLSAAQEKKLRSDYLQKKYG